jgi:tRNA(Ile)-lysidine synthase
MMSMLTQVRQTIDRNQLLERGETVVVGVSGGPDSLCLLHLLCRLRAELALSLHVAHLHHGLRGAEADADAAFVRTVAADWGLPCHTEQANVRALGDREGWAVEEAARRARYEFLARVAERVGARTIAVGHNADDQAETILMHMIRGAGLSGLRGMLPRSRLGDYRLVPPEGKTLGEEPAFAHLSLIRPLLEISREEVEAYCDAHGLEARFDRSNLDTTPFRNWLRHVVFPLLEQHNPALKAVLRRSAHIIADEYALLRGQLEEAWPRFVRSEDERAIAFDLDAWCALPTALQRSSLREAIHRLRRSLRDISFVHVEDALHVARDGTTGMQATLPQGLMLHRGYDELRIAGADHPIGLPDGPWLAVGAPPLALPLPGEREINPAGWIVRLQRLPRRDLPADWDPGEQPWCAALDAAALGKDLHLRTRRPGDRFQPQGMGGHQVKLGDFFTNQKVPRHVRDRLPLLVTSWGIAWVSGLRVDERACVTRATTQIVQVEFIGPGPGPVIGRSQERPSAG